MAWLTGTCGDTPSVDEVHVARATVRGAEASSALIGCAVDGLLKAGAEAGVRAFAAAGV